VCLQLTPCRCQQLTPFSLSSCSRPHLPSPVRSFTLLCALLPALPLRGLCNNKKQVKKHTAEDDAWIVVGNSKNGGPKVYDVTK
jgi:hypothetical protein